MSSPSPSAGSAFWAFRDGGGYFIYEGETYEQAELRVRRIRRQNRRVDLMMQKSKALNERPMEAMREWASCHKISKK